MCNESKDPNYSYCVRVVEIRKFAGGEQRSENLKDPD